ncbi:MAG: SMC-Scp complex subunit ScpB [Anaerolineales bacterium]|jgi:segregation and condensation protein B
MPDEITKETEFSISARIEAILFVAPLPVTLNQLSEVLGISNSEVEKGLQTLETQYKDNQFARGLRLQRYRGRYQLTTSPLSTADIEKFFGLDSKIKLSTAALEVLSIILFFQPVTRPKIDSIRGVNSDGVIKSLLRKGLIQEEGRIDSPGRPILYGTTPEFLQHFGVNSLEELPKLDLDQDQEITLENNQTIFE